ncbi:MAG TPA: hypothetical protein VN428_16530, partial [Bryobacteraceae bacterium]|nr:hypothetical protein [Bryobacteraceae bacterium]
SQHRTAATAWVQGAYWLSVIPVTGLLRLLEKLLVNPESSVPLLAVRFGVVALFVLLVGSALVLLAIGARRLALFE